jgi:hypothetical protein
MNGVPTIQEARLENKGKSGVIPENPVLPDFASAGLTGVPCDTDHRKRLFLQEFSRLVDKSSSHK